MGSTRDTYLSGRQLNALNEIFGAPGLGRRSLLGGGAVLGAGLAGGMIVTPSGAQAADAPAAEITVDQARTAPIPIVIPSFGPGVGEQITGVLTDDLSNTGLFKVIPSSANSGTPDFAPYKAMGARAAVTGTASGSGTVRVEFRLWDVLTGQQIQGTAYTTSAANWRRIAHIIGDVIYQRMLGEKGYFDTRIGLISRSGSIHAPRMRLAVMDQDGANYRVLSSSQTKLPSFNPVRDQIAFLSYATAVPRIYIFDLATGRQHILGDFNGVPLGPHYSPDGGTIIVPVARGSGSELYSVNIASGAKRQLTSSGGAINVSPSFSPDGSQIVFNSDRGGSPALYIMSASGGAARRLSYGSGNYGDSVWSPRGDLIGFTRIAGGQFSLGVMNPDGTGERIMTQGYTVESPTFCPNGRVLAFCRRTGGENGSARIHTIDITGFHEHAIATPEGASSPTWSPLNV
ncbi:Tol-Pal system protein TolB [Acetobacter oeni]|uniref:Tol-Pal system protein TolB n=1 Tax=Acetobacter oeni TaxID=304077 RepID=A0A511XL77_9PROT|nr:Tol-Pal system protein TolB [Acetobacter oeni]MBB3883915.1 TolB protein [Acetobacter oeni]NHO19922.1 Tol-Pal system protein TolB [Acetobacter oeni]GBR02643.1 translocation protein TolB [Acetobacter oeni LMG 21952]GEN63703.1 protein TolB [Acetobacter oeni]